MDTHSWLMYLALVIIATSTPGPAVLFTTTNSLIYGWRKSVFTALGNITGLFCLGVIAISGLGALLKTSVVAFTIVKYAGAVYLVFLGLKLIIRKTSGDEFTPARIHPGHIFPLKLFVQAWGVAMSNPKAIVFLTALFPQFLDIHKPVISQFSRDFWMARFSGRAP